MGRTRAVPAGLSGVVAVAAGSSHSLALKADGTVVAWGDNDFGQSDVPAGLSGVVAVAAGGDHSLALKADGTVVAWGNNNYGQSAVPAGLTGVVAVAAGGDHSLALKADGTVVGWGINDYGQSAVPAGLRGVVAVGAGAFHSLALLPDPPPSVSAGGLRLGAEGSAIALDATVTDANGDAFTTMWTYTPVSGVDPGATCTFANAAAVDTTVTCTDNGNYDVTLTASNSVARSSKATVQVSNRVPVVGALSGPPGPAAPNTAVQVSTTVSDPGANDTLTCSVIWGDATSSAGTIADGTCTASHTYAAAGSFTVRMTASDDDGASAARQMTVTVSSVAVQTITFADPGPRTYGDAPFTVSATATSELPVSFSVPSGDPCTISGAMVTITAAGTCHITASQAGDGNYQAAQPVPRDVTIARAALAITASNASMTYGGDAPAVTASYSEFVNGEGPSALSSSPTCGGGAATTAAGTYPGGTSCSGAAAANYAISYVAGTLTVAKAPLVITASNASMTYGGAPPAVTASYSGFVNDQGASALSSPPTCAGGSSTTAARDLPGRDILLGGGGRQLRHLLCGRDADGGRSLVGHHRLRRLHDLRRHPPGGDGVLQRVPERPDRHGALLAAHLRRRIGHHRGGRLPGRDVVLGGGGRQLRHHLRRRDPDRAPGAARGDHRLQRGDDLRRRRPGGHALLQRVRQRPGRPTLSSPPTCAGGSSITARRAPTRAPRRARGRRPPTTPSPTWRDADGDQGLARHHRLQRLHDLWRRRPRRSRRPTAGS